VRVLVIPEDPTNNGYILRPLVTRIMAEVGRPHARVQVLTNPRVMGFAQAVQAMRGQLADRYAFYDLWLFLPDADVAAGLPDLEAEMSQRGIRLMCCAAEPEIEAWLLAGHRDRLNLPWQELRRHARLKEGVFEPFLKQHGDPRSAGGGRDELMARTLANYRGLLSVCPELQDLEERLRDAVSAIGGPP